MSAFAERLVTQRLKNHQRRMELEIENSRLEGKQQQLEELQCRLKVAQGKNQKVEAVRLSLEKLNDETEEQYNTAKKKEEEERLLLSTELKKKIEEVNDMTTAVAAEEIKVSHANRTFKEQMEIYDKHGSAGRERYDELMNAREGELEKIKEKQLNDADLIPELQKILETETIDLEVARKEHDELKAKVQVYLDRFSEIQTQLDRSKEAYEVAKGDKDRQVRTIRALESDHQQIQNRLKRSLTDRNKEAERARVMEEKLEELKRQIAQFHSMMTMFEHVASESEEGVKEAK